MCFEFSSTGPHSQPSQAAPLRRHNRPAACSHCFTTHTSSSLPLHVHVHVRCFSFFLSPGIPSFAPLSPAYFIVEHPPIPHIRIATVSVRPKFSNRHLPRSRESLSWNHSFATPADRFDPDRRTTPSYPSTPRATSTMGIFSWCCGSRQKDGEVSSYLPFGRLPRIKGRHGGGVLIVS